MGYGHFNEGETKAQKCLKTHRKVIKQILLRPWRPKPAFRPRTTESLLAPWVTQAEPREHGAGGQGRCCPSSSLGPRGGGGGCVPQQAQVGRDPSHLVPWRGRVACSNRLGVGWDPSHLVPLAQAQGLEEAQSKATSLPPSRPPQLRSGWSSSSSGSRWGGRGALSIQCQP